MTSEEIALTMCTAMMGRLYISGHLDRMSNEQKRLVRAGVDVYKSIRSDIAQAVPYWPLGLPHWDDPWIALGLRAETASYLTVWRRWAAESTVELHIPHLREADLEVQVLYPDNLQPWRKRWDSQNGSLTLTSTGQPPAARIYRLREQ